MAISKRDIIFGASGAGSALMVTIFAWLITENGRLTNENAAIQYANELARSSIESATRAKVRVDDLEIVLGEAQKKFDEFESLSDSAASISKLQDFRDSAKDEAIKASISYLEKRFSLPVIASIRVVNGKVINSFGGASFNTGVVSFNNPQSLNFIPIVSDYSTESYMTNKTFIRGIAGSNQFTVWETALDTSSRNDVAKSFTAIVVGLPQSSSN